MKSKGMPHVLEVVAVAFDVASSRLVLFSLAFSLSRGFFLGGMAIVIPPVLLVGVIVGSVVGNVLLRYMQENAR